MKNFQFLDCLRTKMSRAPHSRRSRHHVSQTCEYAALEPRQLLSANTPPTVVNTMVNGGDTSTPDQWQSIEIQFSEDVAVDEASLRLFNDTNAGADVDLQGVQFSYNSQTHTATWDFSELAQPLGPDRYSFLIPPTQVSDLDDGFRLDGNGDGIMGDAYGGKHYVALPGDSNLDGTVDVLGDAFELVNNLGTSGSPTWQQADFNHDGNVDVLGDGFLLIGNLGQSVNEPANLFDGAVNLSSRETFDEISVRDDNPGALNVREVKFLITEVNSDFPRLHFINTNNHVFHYYFFRDVLNYSASPGQFNSQTYFTNSNRANLAGTLIAHENYVGTDGQEGLVTLEFWPTDPVAFRFVEKAWQLISESSQWLDGQLAYHPASETQWEAVQQEQSLFDTSEIELIHSDELFGQVSYQPMNQSESFGRLVLADSAGALTARDIPIFRTLPNDLASVSGIITEVQQTPLSHVNLKARQNNIPNAFIEDASTDPRITPFLDQLVYFRVGPDGFELRLATQQEVDDHFESLRPTDPQFPERDLSVTQIAALGDIGFHDANAFGSKAANVAELQHIMPNVAPDGFAIPYYFYDEYMKFNGFYAEVQQIMSDATFQSDPEARKDALGDFRDRIRDDGLMPAWMYDALTTLQGSFDPEITPRLRSSANAEDLEGFTGAGLYNSYTHHADEGHISKSVKQVWASLWTFRGYEEREFYRVDHLQAAMGVLVHPNYSDELANGVAVTKNIFDPNWEGYYINVQVDEDLITNPNAASIPEELLVANLLGQQEYEIQYIRSSNQVDAGQRVMTQTEILELVSRMDQINQHFASLYGTTPEDRDFVMEIEFKITADGDLAIKQARPWVG